MANVRRFEPRVGCHAIVPTNDSQAGECVPNRADAVHAGGARRAINLAWGGDVIVESWRGGLEPVRASVAPLRRVTRERGDERAR